ncbi:MAG: cytochrome c [Chloroflexi bacterium]|uniref:Cytochrome c n=1 Tax=Candidatus Chlorohelix allophototropha TaxID=3003348 RepID=A0A8T7M1W8_9CHLR|nr:cytochrome c [Chloroflexota bacterium]WJW67657.1 cytochrome c [Chloroflexota bacterium L227-S17]
MVSKKGKLLRFSWLLLLVAFVLVACGDNGSSKTTATPEARNAPAVTTAAAATTAAQAAATTAAQAAATTAAQAATTSAATTAAATTAAAAGNATNGSQIFRRTCQVCHSNGGTATGADGQPNLAASTKTNDPAFIRQTVRDGRKGVITPGIDMPSFNSVNIRDAELEDIVAYIGSIKTAGYAAPTPTPMPTVVVPANTVAPTRPAPTPPNGSDGKVISSSASRGEVIFRNTCQRCHANGGRTRGDANQPNLSTNGNTWNPDFVRSFIYNGSPTPTLMPKFGPNLTPQELEDLVKYITTINTTQKPTTPIATP